MTRRAKDSGSDLSDFESIIPREVIRTAAQNELKDLYETLGDVTIDIDIDLDDL